MFLEIASVSGALLGAFIAAFVSPSVIAVVFGLILLHSTYVGIRGYGPDGLAVAPDRLATRLRMNSVYPSSAGIRHYNVTAVGPGMALMVVAGALSGLLGIGSGALKVIAMDRIMKIPYKVSSTTSNFMIGVTAAASAGIYLHRGYIDPTVALPVMLGVLAGSLVGSRILTKAKTRLLRIVFAVTVGLVGLEMIYKGLAGRF